MAVKALLHYALEVPDQGAGEKFYTAFGLVNASGRDDAVRPASRRRSSESRCSSTAGRRSACITWAFGAPGAEYEATREAVRRAGVREVDPPRGRAGRRLLAARSDGISSP